MKLILIRCFFAFRLQWNFSPRHHTSKNRELPLNCWSTGSSITSTPLTTTLFDSMSLMRQSPLRGHPLTLQRRPMSSRCRSTVPLERKATQEPPAPARPVKAELCPHHDPAAEEPPHRFPGARRRQDVSPVRSDARHHGRQRRKPPCQVAAG